MGKIVCLREKQFERERALRPRSQTNGRAPVCGSGLTGAGAQNGEVNSDQISAIVALNGAGSRHVIITAGCRSITKGWDPREAAAELLPAPTAYFFVKAKLFSIFARTSSMWVQYLLKPPL
jgi:hypothetical protein